MSAQSDTATEYSKGVFPRTYSPGRQQRFYDGYDAIDWHRKEISPASSEADENPIVCGEWGDTKTENKNKDRK
jgi:hypothetical protein